ncbi:MULTISPECIES: FUSC family protein [Agrobacterium]|uniref:FUSC family protein n=1 Tax=Agrobacterium tumefaciens TaxID=358 RepID=A0A4D7YH34_AGRTU|nr:FUSC family protein [Agrobacterium tumefaciens]QCL96771.1 FUSC family protein [Agrobacterium tumefaciens]
MLGYTQDDIVFAMRTFAAAALALYIALAAELSNPYWAVATVFIVANPLAGSATSKAVYRTVGTIVGGIATVVIVPNLVNEPELLLAALGLWIAICLGWSILDGTPRSYAFMLGGYSAALTGFPILDTPATAFTNSVSRVEEILLGALCVVVLTRIVRPRPIAPIVRKRLDKWFLEAMGLIADILRNKHRNENDIIRRLAADIADMRTLSVHLSYDTSKLREGAPIVNAALDKLVEFLPLAGEIADIRRQDCDGYLANIPSIADFLRFLAARLAQMEPFDAADRATITSGLEEIRTTGTDAWNRQINHILADRICSLVTLHDEVVACNTRLNAIDRGARPLPLSRPRKRGAHKDVAKAVLSGLSVLGTIGVVEVVGIASHWPQTNVAAMMGAVICCLFSTFDDPVPLIKKTISATVFSAAIAFVIQFGIFPAIDGYVLLVMVIAPVLILTGLLMTRPATFAYGLGFGVNIPTLLGLQDRLSLDLASFLNSAIATTVGLVAAAAVVGIVRSMTPATAASSILRTAREDIGRGVVNLRASHDLLHRNVNRLSALSPRWNALPPDQQGIDILRDYRVVVLRARAAGLNLEEVFRRVIAELHNNGSSDGGQARAELLRVIDSQLAETTQAETREVLASIRYTLFPDGPSPKLPGPVFKEAAE